MSDGARARPGLSLSGPCLRAAVLLVAGRYQAERPAAQFPVAWPLAGHLAGHLAAQSLAAPFATVSWAAGHRRE